MSRKKWKNKEDILYLYCSSQFAFKYYAKQFGFDDDEYAIGIFSRGTLGNYTKDLDKLRGNKRVWLVFSHVYTGEGIDEE